MASTTTQPVAYMCGRSLAEREKERSSIRRSVEDSFKQGTPLLSSLVSHFRFHDHHAAADVEDEAGRREGGQPGGGGGHQEGRGMYVATAV